MSTKSTTHQNFAPHPSHITSIHTPHTPLRKGGDDRSTTCAKPAASTASLRETAHHFAPLWPSAVGLALSRSGLVISDHQSSTSLQASMFTDGSMLLALMLLGCLLVVLARSKVRLTKYITNKIMYCSITLQALSLVALAALTLYIDAGYTSSIGSTLYFVFETLCALSSSATIFYWLRRVRGAATVTTTIFVFSALLLSEVLCYLYHLMTPAQATLGAALCVVIQVLCIRWARRRVLAQSIHSPTFQKDYFGFTKHLITSKQFLSATAVAIGVLSLAIGLLRGYPFGSPTTLDLTGCSIACVLIVIITLVLIVLTLTGHQQIMTVGVFVLMELLACVALFLFALFPTSFDKGAIVVTVLNSVMVAFTWYIIIVFMSYGWRDPYYYAIAGWLVWVGCRCIAQLALLGGVYLFSENTLIETTLTGILVLISAQVLFVQLLGIIRQESTEQTQKVARRNTMLTKLMALDEHESLTGLRQASMRHSSQEMGEQFLLSEREIDVLSMYALGFTQKRVAQELYISPGTVHGHIKRIYAKTGLHSRQEILDYLKKYTS